MWHGAGPLYFLTVVGAQLTDGLGSRIAQHDPWCTARGSRKVVAVWRLLPLFPATLGETRA